MNEPIKKFKAGAITATIWKNKIQKDEKEYTSYSTTIEKSYKDKNDEWKKTNSYGDNELPKVQLVTAESYKYIQEIRNNGNESTGTPKIQEEQIID